MAKRHRVSRRQRRASLFAALVGLIATALALLLYRIGALDQYEHITLDLRFALPFVNPIRPSDEITCVDINDRALELAGRWPWPRDQHAWILSALHELGAKAILVDITYTDREVPRAVWSGDTEVQRRDLAAMATVFPDHELARAIRRCGNVYLAYHYPLVDYEKSRMFRRAVEALRSNDRAAAERHLEQLQDRFRAGQEQLRKRMGSATVGRRLSPAQAARVVAEMLSERAWSDDAFLRRAPQDQEAQRMWQEALPRCKEAALRMGARAWLDTEPTRWDMPMEDLVFDLTQELLGRHWLPGDDLSERLRIALREVLSYRETVRRAVFPLERVDPITPEIDGFVPVYRPFAQAAARCGFVNIQPEQRDRALRTMRLLASHEGNLLGQIAFAVACDELGVSQTERDPPRIQLVRGGLQLRPTGGGKPTLVPMAHGSVVIPWVPVHGVKPFRTISAHPLWNVGDQRRVIAANRRAMVERLGALIPDSGGEEFERDRGTVRQIRTLWRALAEAQGREDEAEMDDLSARLAAVEDALLARLEAYRSYHAAHPSLTAQAFLEELARAEANIASARSEVERTLNEFRDAVRDRICLLGYTATSLADMVATPTEARTPGVMAHANLLNGLITGQMPRSAPAWINVLLVVLLGAAGTASSVLRRPRQAMLDVTLVLLAFVLLAGWGAFHFWLYWVWLVPAVLACLLAYFSIAVYRYIFVDRERRELATALGQYTSRTIALQVAENPDLCRKAEMREVSVMFTDLRGFTGLSEQLGAERTQRLLNVCLGRFTDVMLQQEALVNKFLGDGILAFWNPVIYSQPDHALRACETAVNLLLDLQRLQQERGNRQDGDVFGKLRLGIGVATGNAIVGPCGSEQKFDYTCIGDSVNIASRLESANKVFGTAVLVNETTRLQAGDRFAYRPLGGVRVKGRQAAVQVFELLGRRDQVEPRVLEQAELFGRGVTLFQERRFAEAADVFEHYLRLRPNDPAARDYRGAAQHYADYPPSPDWNRALDLVEK